MHLARSLRIRAGIPLLLMCVVVAAGVSSACGATPAAQPTTAPQAPSATASVAAVPSPQRPPLASPVASPSPSPGTQGNAVPSGPGEIYEVKAGDTLLLIAQQFYGDVTLWRRIYDANRDVIGDDPDKLALGMRLRIPPRDG